MTMHAARPAANQLVEFLLDAAHAFLVNVDPAEHVREKFVLGIDAAVFFLEEHAFQIHFIDAFDNFGRKFFGEAHGLGRVANFCFEIFGGNASTRDSRRATISGSLTSAGSAKTESIGNAGSQLASFAVVDIAAHRTDFKCALLLMLGFGEVIAIAEELEVTQAGQHRPHPNRRHAPDDQPAETRVALLHGFRPNSLRNFTRQEFEFADASKSDSIAARENRGPAMLWPEKT